MTDQDQELGALDPRDALSPLRWDGPEIGVQLLDQLQLPGSEVWRRYADYHGVAEAIRSMVVRGAPAIGIAAAYGVVLGVHGGAPVESVIATLAATRPTAVNLFWALERMRGVCTAHAASSRAALVAALEAEAVRIHDEDLLMCRRIGVHGAGLLPPGNVLTHCNAGALATGGYGTALGVIRSAVRGGTRLHVLADETRPYLQGARLTAWELQRSEIPVTLICDNMAGHLMARNEVQSIIVGADRIARNGDTANKIGTYTLAVLARAHGVPFFVAAPRSTLDLSLPTGAGIPIEERSTHEVVTVGSTRIAPVGIAARHPAFDVTPGTLITAIITDAGVAYPPYAESLPPLLAAR